MLLTPAPMGPTTPEQRPPLESHVPTVLSHPPSHHLLNPVSLCSEPMSGLARVNTDSEFGSENGSSLRLDNRSTSSSASSSLPKGNPFMRRRVIRQHLRSPSPRSRGRAPGRLHSSFRGPGSSSHSVARSSRPRSSSHPVTLSGTAGMACCIPSASVHTHCVNVCVA